MQRQSKRKGSLKKRFILLYVVLMLVPLAGLSLLFTSTSFRYMRQNGSSSTESAFRQTGQLLEYYISNVDNEVNSLLGNALFHEILEKDNTNLSKQEQVQDMLTIRKLLNACQSKSEVSGVFVYVDNEAIYIGETAQIRSLSDVADASWYEYVESSYPGSVMIPSAYLDNANAIGYAKAVRGAKDYTKTVGILFFELNKSLLTEYLGESETLQVSVINREGELIARSGAESVEVPADLLEECGDGASHTVSLDGKSYFLYAKELEKTNWYLVCLEPCSILYRLLAQQGLQYLLVFLFVLFLGLVFFYLFFRLCVDRITMLTEHMAGIREKLPPPVAPGRGGDEIDQLIDAYNYMLGQADGLLKKQYELGNQIKESEMKALYEQINPHFLYNTLTMINWLAEDGQVEDVTRVITALSGFYRLSLNKGSENIRLKEELEIARNFVYIQQMRFGTDIRLECEVEPIYEDFVMPKLTLQPLVENALVHGILKRRDKSGVIRIAASDEEGMLLLCITDTGVGMDSGTVEKLNNGTLQSGGKHYGVWNVLKRAELFYGAPCRLTYESEEGRSVKAVLALPYRA